LCGGIAILDAERNFEPAAFLQFNASSQDQYEVVKTAEDHWEVTFDKIHSPGPRKSASRPTAASSA